MSKPLANSSTRWPGLAATGVVPQSRCPEADGTNFDFAFTSAPCSISSFTTSGWCSETAHISGSRIAPGFLRVHLCAMVQQNFNGVDLPGSRGHHQSRVAGFRKRGIGVGSGLEERLDHCRVAVNAGEEQRRGSRTVRGRDLRARANQQVGGLQVVGLHGPMQRGRAVDLRRVDVSLLLHQAPDRRPVAIHGRVRHRG